MHGADVCTLLKGDNEKLCEIVDELAETTSADVRRDLMRELQHEIGIHRRIAEEVFYPEVKTRIAQPNGRLFVQHATEDHRLIDRSFDALSECDVASKEFDERQQVMRSIVRRHADEEEEIFRRIRIEMDTETMQRLGARVNQARLEREDLYPDGRAEHLGTAGAR